MSKQYGWEWISGLITSGRDDDHRKPLDLPDEGASLVWDQMTLLFQSEEMPSNVEKAR